MATNIRAEVSLRNKYFIERHRYHELKHFCMQYPTWKKIYADILQNSYKSSYLRRVGTKMSDEELIEKCTEARVYFSNRIEMVEKTAEQANPEIANLLVIGITKGISYDILRVRYNVPCGKEMYYEAYRKFFWLLDQVRQ